MSGEMNADLQERFGRHGAARREDTDDKHDEPRITESAVERLKLKDYYRRADEIVNKAEPWVKKPEFPDPEELDGDESTVHPKPNKVTGPYASKEEYLRMQYELLREDAIRPLRSAITAVRKNPSEQEASFAHTIGIYEKVHIVGKTFSTQGVATRIVFSTARAGKQIPWQQSKRLMPGSLVALTYRHDMFKIAMFLATVAARPLSGLEKNPPEIDLFVSHPYQVMIDPMAELVMVEDRSSYYEAHRHTLKALQKMTREQYVASLTRRLNPANRSRCPKLFHDHVISASPQMSAPSYVSSKVSTDLSPVFGPSHDKQDIQNDYPIAPPSSLDQSQHDALRRVLTTSLAVIQGPPGTGKTHVSVQALRVLIANLTDGPTPDPPIIVACQTNHALDQLLRHVSTYTKKFVRLGGRSNDKVIVKNHTLYEMKQQADLPSAFNRVKRQAQKDMNDLEKEMKKLLLPLTSENEDFIDHRILRAWGILSRDQAKSLETNKGVWTSEGENEPVEQTAMGFWLGGLKKGRAALARNTMAPHDFGFPEVEGAELELEQLKEDEAERAIKSVDEIEKLKGEFIQLRQRYVGVVPRLNVEGNDLRIKLRAVLDKCKNMKDVPAGIRGAVYSSLVQQWKDTMLLKIQELEGQYNKAAEQRRRGAQEADLQILKGQALIGCTVTGFNKNRALIDALSPKIILIEEAGEVLEAPVAATFLSSVEHVILVGDHQQLRPHCHVKVFEGEPMNMNISLFERLVSNGVEYDYLSLQRRMIPQISRLLTPIYGDKIRDHPVVCSPTSRPPVPGMAGTNLFFLNHVSAESKDSFMSFLNVPEAEMIAGMASYLVDSGLEASSITMLTFYNGQRKELERQLSAHRTLFSHKSAIKVATVDSYQGEENDVVFLSTVRNNDRGSIGFLGIVNRVCVALSRARRGFYIFGNADLVGRASGTWRQVLGVCPLVTEEVVVACVRHAAPAVIRTPDDWRALRDGCPPQCAGGAPWRMGEVVAAVEEVERKGAEEENVVAEDKEWAVEEEDLIEL
ncbi:hypothetical protein M8818_004168 [Zalaria obscura]|uniref:Uncharacterized protein n=1 Tax=Zalaria obscura TaxID=2024903 RepID=A0ACC3SCX4_9PEZI